MTTAVDPAVGDFSRSRAPRPRPGTSNRILRRAWLAGLAAIGAHLSAPVHAQAMLPTRGDYVAVLGSVHIKLHLRVADGAALGGTLDSPDQGAVDLPLTDIRVQGSELSFAVPVAHGSWSGTIEDGGATLKGTWTQGTSIPLNFTRDPFVAADKPSAVDGFWRGTVQALGRSKQIQISVKSDRTGQEYCVLDVINERAFGLECANVTFAGGDFSFDVPPERGHWRGKLTSDAQALEGLWSQGAAANCLRFVRQRSPIPRPAPRSESYTAALAPVPTARMHAMLDRDLRRALKDGALAPKTSAGLTIGIVRNGHRRVVTYGTAKPDALFEIGSITKTFTGLVLAQMVVRGQVRLDEPIRELLPADATVAPPGPAEITLRDLITHRSGLPRLPANLNPADVDDPYADYRPQDLYQFIRQHGVTKPFDASFLYSNLGVGLLGQALANRARVPFAQLLAENVTKPLGLKDTTIALSPGQQARLIQGYTLDHQAVGEWHFDALAAAGALRSTVSDMLTYLQAQLHPERLRSSGSPRAVTLAEAIVTSHELQADIQSDAQVALAWSYHSKTGDYSHGGGTGGYSSYAFFNPREDYAAIVLFNTESDPQGGFAERLGEHISERLGGRPAVRVD